MSTHNMFSRRNKKNINTFWLKKWESYLELWFNINVKYIMAALYKRVLFCVYLLLSFNCLLWNFVIGFSCHGGGTVL